MRSGPPSCVGPYAIAYRRAPVPGLRTRTRRDGSEDRLVKLWSAMTRIEVRFYPYVIEESPRAGFPVTFTARIPPHGGRGAAPLTWPTELPAACFTRCDATRGRPRVGSGDEFSEFDASDENKADNRTSHRHRFSLPYGSACTSSKSTVGCLALDPISSHARTDSVVRFAPGIIERSG